MGYRKLYAYVCDTCGKEYINEKLPKGAIVFTTPKGNSRYIVSETSTYKTFSESLVFCDKNCLIKAFEFDPNEFSKK